MTLLKSIDNHPLSSTQKEIWFHQMLHPKLPLYNIGGYLQIEGPIDPAFFEQALNQVIEDNDALRIIIHEGESLPTQTFAENVRIQLDFQDFSAQEKAHQAAQAWMKQEFAKPFPLYDQFLFQLALCKVSDNCYYSFQKYHHLIVDGWAISLIVQRVAAAYNALATGLFGGEQKQASYKGFLQNDQAYLESEKFAKAKHYWIDKYREIPEPLLLRRYGTPFADPITPSQLSILTLKRPFYNQLAQLAAKNKASTFHVILGALYCYFAKTTGQKDIIIGLPILNRGTAAFKQTVGLFTNLIPARFHFGLDLSFVELMQAISIELRRDYRYQRFPMSEINRRLHLTQRRPLFDLMLSYLKNDYDIHFNRSPAAAVNLTPGFAQNALEISVCEFHPNIDVRVDFEYNLGFFDSEEIELIKARFKFLLGEILRQPELPVRKLSIIPKVKRQKMLECSKKGNLVHPTNPFIEFPKCEQSISARFEQQVQQYPNQIAVKTQRYEWTYQNLNDKANQVAQHLLDACQASERIALLFEHDAPMLAGLMGVLKAGKTYVPLAPDFPSERLEYIVQDSQASAILTNEQNLSLAQILTNKTTRLINIDELDGNINDIDLNVSPDSIAYLIYTSGSTGQPKGVIQNHRNVLHFIRTYTNNLHITAADKLTLLSYYSFDAAVVDIFTTLLNGATLYPINLKETDFTALSAWLIQQQVTIYHSTPTVYRHWLNTLIEKDKFSHLRLIVLGGEPVYKSDVDGYKKHFLSNCIFVNGLGSTESTFSFQYLIDQQTQITRHEVPVGYPLSETEIILLDDTGTETDIYGEITIKSPYLALGYWQKPELTQAVFLTEEGNQRIYRTGDMGRFLPDGSLEFVGRKDFQIKLRGVRIELGEIEAVLGQHSAVRENVVTVHEESGNDKYLVAYLVPNPEAVIETSELRRFLTEKLPDYMIPKAFIPLEAMPLTLTGKIDRRALAQLSVDSGKDSEESFIAPQTPEEELLAGIWMSVLGIAQVGCHDNFFELGGHSLLATQVMSRIRDTFSIELSFRHLFESPTIAKLNNKIQILQSEQPNLLLAPPIKPLARRSDLPLSFAQERLWFLEQLMPGNPFYNTLTAVRFVGSLDMAALEQSFFEIVQRHEVLRTTFSIVNGIVTQIIHPFTAESFRFSKVNLQGLPPETQSLEIQRLATLEAQRTFDLKRGPLLRATLLQLRTDEYILQVAIHHIVTDGWSTGIFIQELLALYEALAAGQSSPLPALPIQYADFAYWQRQWLSGTVLETQLSYWQQHLANAPRVLEIPLDHPRPPAYTFRGDIEHFEITPELTQQLKSLTQHCGVTLFMTSLAAFAILLSRYSGSDDIVIGSPIANRTHKEIEPLIGFFVNTLVLRIDLSGNPTFLALLKRVRQTTLGAYAHQDLPFEHLVETLQPERDMSQNPLVQIALVFQNAPMPPLELPDLILSPVTYEEGTVRFDLEFHLWEASGQLMGNLYYYKDVFEAATILRLLRHFQTLLASIAANIEQPISEYSLLTDSERHQFLVEWNNTQADYPTDICLHQLFEAQVERTPEAIAVVFEDQYLTYRELNFKANQLAHHLQSLGVKPEVFVGICVERSLERVYGLLGILKAGGAYLPLEPDLPSTRLAFLLTDAQALVLITTTKLEKELSGQIQTQVVCLDTGAWKMLATEAMPNPINSVQPEHLAYMIYTSGSTGKPKGVLIEHRAVVNTIIDINQRFKVNSQDSVLALSALNFDLSVYDIFGLLAAGGTVVIPNAFAQATKDPTHWLELMAQHQITLWNTVPALMQMLVDYLSEQPQRTPNSLRLTMMSGDWIPLNLPTRIKTLWPQAQIISLGGATEASIWSIYYPITEVKPTWKSIPYGKPLANQTFYVLDESLVPCPLLVPGYLYIGGVGLARGYWGDPDKTQASFIIHPHLQKRIYKTGDLGRYLPDGHIEFLGRKDNQVKLRGFRIELGEIEAVLTQHLAVQKTVVIVRQDSSNNRHLVAYFITHEQQVATVPALRSFLREKLPDYMVPSAFVELETFPLTPNGKIDRGTLPAPENFRSQVKAAYVKPQTKAEQIIADIWQQTLNLEKVGIHDNFFDIGGHSLLMVSIHSQLQKHFEQELSMVNLFQYPTIQDLANYLSQNQSSTSDSQSKLDRTQRRRVGNVAMQQKRQRRQRKTMS